MTQAFLRYSTPLRICAVYLIIQTIIWYFAVQKTVENGYNPELGGLAPYIFGGLAIIAFILDLILSLILKPKINWVVQLLVLLGAVLVFLSNS